MSVDFPSSGSRFEVFVHPVTKAPYVYEDTKNSWMSLASLGAQVYSGTQDPGLNGITLQDGDIWWDSHHLELRIFHKPFVPGEDIIGRWVSSTNPEMSPQDPNRNRYIGTVELVAPEYDIYEDLETTWEATLVGGTLNLPADMDMLEVEWQVSPSTIPKVNPDGSVTDIDVIIFNPDQLTTNIVWPKGTYFVENGEQIGYNVFCRITAKPEFEEEFIKVTERSKSTRVYPKVSLDSTFTDEYTFMAIDMPSTVTADTIIGFGSHPNITQSGDEFSLSNVIGIETKFFVEDNVSGVDSTQAPLIFTTVEDSQQPADIISSGYQALTEEYFEDDTARNGYTIDVTGLASGTPIYVYSSYDPTLKGKITLV